MSRMLVMCANQSGIEFGRMVGLHPGQLGHLYSPGAQRRPHTWLPYALDNGAFPAFTNERPWDETAWLALLDWAEACGQPPLWALVPDVVADPVATLAAWEKYAPIIKQHGWPAAFAVQDGHTPADVPAGADVIFIGGSTDWKRANIATFCAAFPRVHVGRINTRKWLDYCVGLGVESCDGTGWFRGDRKQLQGLYDYLASTSNPQLEAA